MKKNLTEQEKKDYIEAGAIYCPNCGSKDINAGRPDVAEEIYLSVDCSKCLATWTETYTLTDVEIDPE